MSALKRVELYEHDDDLCARGCGRGCSRNTHQQGFADGVAFARAEVRELKQRVRLARAECRLLGSPDRIYGLLDKPLPKARRK